MSADQIHSLGALFWAALPFFGLLAVVQLLLLPALVEVFRQRLFGIRRELFLYMVDGYVAPTEEAYELLLGSANALIRYAQIVTMARALFSLPWRAQSKEFTSRLEAAIGRISDPEARKKLASFRDRLTLEAAFHLLRTSPLVWLFALASFVPIFVYSMIKAAREPAGIVTGGHFHDEQEDLCVGGKDGYVGRDAHVADPAR